MTLFVSRAAEAAARLRSVAAEILVFLWAAAVVAFSLLIMALYFLV